MIRTLLADDSEVMRCAITRLLHSDPDIHVLAETASLIEAIDLTRKLRPHVVIMDVHLREKHELTPSEIRESFSGSRIVAISLWNDEETKHMAEMLGAVKLVDKITLASDLIPTIKQLASG